MKISEFDYYIPKGQIAQYPLPKRDSSRLCVVDRRQRRCEHRVFRDIIDLLHPGDVLVLNNTKVIPSRIYGIKPSGGKVEVLLLKEIKWNEWEALVKGVSRGLVFIKDGLNAFIYPSNGVFRVCFEGGDIKALLMDIGAVPLPPYIKRQADEIDKERYQTVYAENEGAIAAPTAGLHFTDELLYKIVRKGVEVIKLTLNVGYGTFKPVKVNDIREHEMDEEYYEIPPSTAEAINRAKAEGRRVIAVGTTVVRALESSSTVGERSITVSDGEAAVAKVRAGTGLSKLFIYPGYNFKVIDALITNLHQPCSTPMMLTSAFAGLDLLKYAYIECQKRGYRFFSYGDAMFIL
ncbi:MAG: tRNA preQ1(34) S-adenosylmethionine ribosyltransferase-isomerase QueA [Thermodesulfovibrionia bacterium]